MKIRVIKSFGGYRIGQEFDWADGMARIYLGRGMVEEVTEREVIVERAEAEPKVEKAVVTSRKKKP